MIRYNWVLSGFTSVILRRTLLITILNIHCLSVSSHFTPADEIVIFHVSILAQVDRHHLAPEQQTLHQHPAKCRHEEEMKQRRHERARHLQTHRYTLRCRFQGEVPSVTT